MREGNMSVGDPETSLRLNPSEITLSSPVLIVGAPRSGTTWIQRLLIAHRQVCGGQESHFFNAFAPVLNYVVPRSPTKRNVGLGSYVTRTRMIEIIQSIWCELMSPVLAAKPSARVLVEKTPDHAHHLKRIFELFPAARCIHVIRDSRAVVASMLAASQTEWGRDWAPADVESAADKWKRSVRDARFAAAQFSGDQYIEAHYEDALTNPFGETSRLLNFIGVDASTREIEEIVAEQTFENQKQSGGSPLFVGGENASVPRDSFEPNGFFNTGRRDAWKESLNFLQKRKVWKITGKLMQELGYDLEGNRYRSPHELAA